MQKEQAHTSNLTYTEKINKTHKNLANINKEKESRHKYTPRIKKTLMITD